MPTLSIALREVAAQPVVCVRTRVARSEIAATIAAQLGRVVPQVLGNGMAAQSLTPAGAPWEVYVNDPAEHPDPAAWRTEIFWPVR